MDMDMDKEWTRTDTGATLGTRPSPGGVGNNTQNEMKMMKESWNDKEVGEGLDGLEEDDKEWKEKRKREEKKKKRERERE